VEEWSDPVHRAAVWYVAAFAALVSVLLAGIQLGSFDWSQARQPLLATLCIAVAVLAAAGVLVVASRVLVPRHSLFSLVERADKARKKLQRKTPSAAVEWRTLAAKDWLLSQLATMEGFTDDPQTLMNGRDAGDQAVAGKADRMVRSANALQSRRTFHRLQVFLPVACIFVVGGAVGWGNFSKTQDSSSSSADPIPVTLTLARTADPATAIGKSCSLRVLSGVAISGDLAQRPLVALPAQGDCAAALVQVTPAVGTVQRGS
jgi:hypothetical protein